MRNYDTKFWIRRSGRPETTKYLGAVESCDVWKGWLSADSGEPVWFEGLLALPEGSTEGIRSHAGAADEIPDKKRAFLRMLDQDGIPTQSLPSEARRALRSKRIHYIL
ncbi:uncharacterized protein CLAFUR5_05339 [Fulvia fulva]|uniref:Uncharacterized protein n=1 Tax=Passalora fulva TaxID=5499 RepID=A0A9Q8LEN8_PASFU|nr:uncharacterized protein CLAFUR5_05339 [Fulvia fulva]KAK4616670.1 hypothetical protein CLAFUR0_10736 [Fulvia fulva]UJO16002.1 hypothetical protein CLAFUR5_05339 [Fulvia fulva]